jgi:hypothetical protein
MASSAGCGFNNMRRGTVLDKLFAEIIDGALRDRGLLHKVVPPAWLSPEMWITVLLTIVGLYKQTAFREGGRPGTRPDLHRFLTTSRLERRRGGSVADCVDKDVRGLPLISVDMDGLQAIAKSSISHLTHQE